MYRKSSCTTPGIDVGVGGDVSKLLKFLRDEEGPDERAIMSRTGHVSSTGVLLQMSFSCRRQSNKPPSVRKYAVLSHIISLSIFP